MRFMYAPSTMELLYTAHLGVVGAAIEQGMAAARLDAVVIQAGDARLAFQDDQTYPFRVNPWFAWLAPVLSAPGSLILIRNNKRPLLIFVSPEDYWHSPAVIPPGSWANAFEIIQVSGGRQALAALPPLGPSTGWIGEGTPPDPALPNPAQLLAHLEQARCHKTPYELACMRVATRAGVTGHLAAEQAFRNGACEFDIHLAFLAASRQNETELPYGSIVALNEHCATLHYQLRDLVPPGRPHSLLIDAGASFHGYASDITRTWAAGPGTFATLVEGMHQLQQDLCETIQPGVDWRDLHLRAHRMVAQLLQETGVLQIAAEDALARGISSTFLPHGLGHLLGLQVHDVGGFRPHAEAEPIARPEGHPALRLTRRLEAGMVVTVEPGLYFIDSLLAQLRAGPHAAAVNWTLVDTLRPCGGIRIEDNVIVTASGHDNMTRAAFAAQV